ncbi:hypothetical protein TWF481_003477 [Arthrobotrys musiformis]|uniref:Hikeshi-like domain-containing protein n=1 Tax=Arthrobotrys musiformis TaxID=47236 RepID=A0AAV9VQJ0_9PEZI
MVSAADSLEPVFTASDERASRNPVTMFGCICAGRQVQTNLQIVSQTEFLFVLPSAQTVNHIVVFLLPDTQLPPDYAATVYFQWPGKPFQLLGGLSMEKQSAIFRLKGNSNTQGIPGTNASDNMVDEPGFGGGENVVAQLGISIEPIGQAQQKLMMLPAHLSALSAPSNSHPSGNALVSAPTAADSNTLAHRDNAATLTLARRIIKNAFNYLGSFSSGPPGSEMVPMREFQSWWNKFEGRLARDSSFLEREEA